MVRNKTVDLKKKPRTSGSSMFFSLRFLLSAVCLAFVLGKAGEIENILFF